MTDVSFSGLEANPELYWNERYKNGHTGWDIGHASPPLVSIIDRITDKSISILIPGAGNAYEALYLAEKGFNNITVIDIAEVLIKKLSERFHLHSSIKILHGNFFDHIGKYDLILEQTFFCALPPALRANYVNKMYSLLNEKAVLTGLLFNRQFEGGPPFGGSREEYVELFSKKFSTIQIIDSENSIEARAGTEIVFSCQP